MSNIINQLKALYQECFSDSKECVEYLFFQRLGIHNAEYKVLNGKVVSAMYLVDKTLKYKQKEIIVPFVVGLSTLHGHREKGLARELMTESLKKSHNAFVMLYPAVKGFYQKMDFANISYDNTIDEKLTKRKSDNPQKLLDIYNLYNKDKDFYIKLNTDDFEQKIIITQKDGGDYYILENQNQTIGFTNNEETVVLGQEPNKAGVMARVVNLEKAFELFGKTINARIKLSDKLIEKNNITFTVKKGKITPCKHYDLEMTMSELTLHFFGLGERVKEFEKLKGRILERY